jgi:hypothetical protein
MIQPRPSSRFLKFGIRKPSSLTWACVFERREFGSREVEQEGVMRRVAIEKWVDVEVCVDVVRGIRVACWRLVS